MPDASALNNRFPENDVLATDLDGTLIPLTGVPDNLKALGILKKALSEARCQTVFATGRHLESVHSAIQDYGLPLPDWIICNVGTSIHRRIDGRFEPVKAFEDHLGELTRDMDRQQLEAILLDCQGLRKQPPERQQPFKLSYFADASSLEPLEAELKARLVEWNAPWSLIASIDPFNGDGLIDFLPADVSKAYALQWWAEHFGHRRDSIVYAGDSGNDTAALTAGFRAILTGNADRGLARKVYTALRAREWDHRLFLAQGQATSGVLEGCVWHGLIGRQYHSFPQAASALPGPVRTGADRYRFRVWAPGCQRVTLILPGRDGTGGHTEALVPDGAGYFVGEFDGLYPGNRYAFSLDGETALPDPASRLQPDGIHGFSELTPGADDFPWRDGDWKGVAPRDLILYELHVGAFTEEGTFLGAIARLDELVDLGITALEIMPVAQTPGRWNWGYDGVFPYAVNHNYGSPDDFRQLVEACHQRGLAVILDVVYNHIGPEGSVLDSYGPYHPQEGATPWGRAFDFESHGSLPAREFVIQNALYWISEYKLDGLRLDAVRLIRDHSDPHLLAELSEAAEGLDTGRPIHLIAESNVFDSRYLVNRPDGGFGLSHLWVDDVAHAFLSAFGGPHQAGGRTYRGFPDLLPVLRQGYLYDETLTASGRAHSPPPAPLDRLVIGLQNHDVAGNDPAGRRFHQLASEATQVTAATLILLHPACPLIFMGEEFASPSPFYFFADFHNESIRRSVAEGRRKEFPDRDWHLAPDPVSERAFRESCLPPAQEGSQWTRNAYRQLIRIRKRLFESGLLQPAYYSIQYNRTSGLVHARLARPGSPAWHILAFLPDPSTDPASRPVASLPVKGLIHFSSGGHTGLASAAPLTPPVPGAIVIEENSR